VVVFPVKAEELTVCATVSVNPNVIARLLFVVAAEGYQPSTYWAVKVEYGSCSGCDTFESIREYGNAPPTDEQAKKYFTLALHIVQGLREVGGGSGEEGEE